MGVYFKDMEKPGSCDECPLYCCPHNFADCPAVAVPAHGRLIDADALYSHIKNEQRACNDPFDGWSECQVALGFVNTAPTIIPAEEGE